jgi:hypothetical protein
MLKRLTGRLSVPLIALLVAVLIGAALPARPAAAQTRNAFNNTYRTTLAYMNLGSTTAQITFTFTPLSGAVRNVTKSLAPNAATFLTVVSATATNSNIGVPGATTNALTKKGSIVVSSTQRIAAVVVQTTSSRTRNRLLTTGFTAASVDDTIYIPTFMKGNTGSGSTQKMSTRLMIQNAGSSTVNYTVNYYAANSADVAATSTGSIAANKSAEIVATSIGALPAGFSGSAVITADGNIVASSIEAQVHSLPTSNQPANAQMGIPASATAQTIFSPSLLCNAGGRTSYVAIQNAGSGQTLVTPTFIASDGTESAADPVTVEANSKQVVSGCEIISQAGVSATSGAVKFVSDVENIAVIVKEDGRGHSSAFEGQPTTAAADTLVAPYVRNAENSRYNNKTGNRLRSAIIIQNVGSSEIPAGKLLVNYYDSRGTLIGTHTIGSALATGASVASMPGNMMLNTAITTGSRRLTSTTTSAIPNQQALIKNNFGYFYYNNVAAQANRLKPGEGGGAVITCAADVVECELLATVRVTGNNAATNGTTNNYAEMYNAVPSN